MRAYILICRQVAERKRETRPGRYFWNCKAIPSGTPPVTRPHLLVITKESTNWEPDIQICEPHLNHHWPNRGYKNGNHKIEWRRKNMSDISVRILEIDFCSGSSTPFLERPQLALGSGRNLGKPFTTGGSCWWQRESPSLFLDD